MNYVSIDELPIYNYRKILQGDELEKHGVKSLSDWLIIEEEFFNQIGFGDKYFYTLRLRTAIIKLKAKYYKTGERFLKTLINAEEEKLKTLSKGEDEQKDNFGELVAGLSKKMGFRIDVKKVSVSEFYSYINFKV